MLVTLLSHFLMTDVTKFVSFGLGYDLYLVLPHLVMVPLAFLCQLSLQVHMDAVFADEMAD